MLKRELQNQYASMY